MSVSIQVLSRRTCRVTAAPGFLVVAWTWTRPAALSADAGRAPVCAMCGTSVAEIWVIGVDAVGPPPWPSPAEGWSSWESQA